MPLSVVPVIIPAIRQPATAARAKLFQIIALRELEFGNSLASSQTGVGPMAETAHQIEHEFWRPPVQGVQLEDVRTQPEICSRCNTDYVVGSRFCHVCGAEREPSPEYQTGFFTRFLDFNLIRESLGLTIGSLVAFIVGIVCVAATVATGFMYTATTVLDWQAVQIWRIEWLLAAAVAFIAGILLKRAAA
jgi:hypothetical protein